MASAAAIDSTYDIVTPENIEFEYQVAGPLRRMPAFLIDVGIRFLIFGFTAFVVWLIAALFMAVTLSTDIAEFIAAFVLVLWFVLEWLYGGLFETFWNGQTPGKRLLGLRVLTTHGEPINGLQAMSRNFLRLADAMPLLPFAAFCGAFGWDPAMPPIDDGTIVLFGLFYWLSPFPTFMVGLVVSAMNRRRQRMGDLVSKTMVIVEERNWLFGMVRMDDPRVREVAATLPTHINIARSTAKALAMYVERRRFFSPPRRQEIAMHLGHPLIERYHLPPVSDHDLLLCAVYYKVFFTEGLEDASPETPPTRQPPGGDPLRVTVAPQIDTGVGSVYRR